MPSKVTYTYEDYARLDDGNRYEVLDGELLMTPAPNLRHQRILVRLFRLLADHVDASDLGEVCVSPLDVILSEIDVVQPDLLFVSKERSSILVDEGVRGAPDLCIEILSPGTARRDRKVKSGIYARHGVRELWIVDPDAERIEVFEPDDGGMKLRSLHEGDDRVVSTVLPEIRLRATDAFEA